MGKIRLAGIVNDSIVDGRSNLSTFASFDISRWSVGVSFKVIYE